MRIFKRIKGLVSKKPFKIGDRVKCPHCGIVITMVKNTGASHIQKGEIK